MIEVTGNALIAVVGVVASGILTAAVQKFEGVKLVGYRDPVGIPTKCVGDTRGVIVGKSYSEAECLESLEKHLMAHASVVLRCTPGLKQHPYQLAAAVSFADNIGPTAYCSSTTARRFNAGDWRGACRAMNESDSGRPQWVTARGRMLRGLVKRRAEERSICEQGLQ
ncbi:lysozyme [Burkholderia ubonensis]|uniref:lysozyme n=1 Tax=Burkholderia ubonensis TaxID=101571 RepID=UPI0009B4C954|nr:lysozyme [Burkholderia ubonensis]